MLPSPFHSPPMSRATLIITCLLGFVAVCASGCVMHRTVKEGNEVVAQGYVVKTPLISPSNGNGHD